MVGYINAPQSYSDLDNELRSGTLGAVMKTIGSRLAYDGLVLISEHERDFKWLESRGAACCITITHIWLGKTGY